MKILFVGIVGLLGFGVSSAYAEQICSPINFCRAEKKTWTSKGWKSNYVKTLDIPKFCDNPRPTLELETDLGIELWQFNGDPKAERPLESQPTVEVNLYTYKLTYVVATGKGLASSNAISFSHRLKPKGSSIVEVECYKK